MQKYKVGLIESLGAEKYGCIWSQIKGSDSKSNLAVFCSYFSDCLYNCPTGVITFGKREAAYDEMTVQENMRTKSNLAQWTY